MPNVDLVGNHEPRTEQDLTHVVSALRGLRYGSVELLFMIHGSSRSNGVKNYVSSASDDIAEYHFLEWGYQTTGPDFSCMSHKFRN